MRLIFYTMIFESIWNIYTNCLEVNDLFLYLKNLENNWNIISFWSLPQCFDSAPWITFNLCTILTVLEDRSFTQFREMTTNWFI